MNPKTRHKKLLENKKVLRWYENLKAKSQVTSDVYLRNFGIWLEYLGKDPESIIEFAKSDFSEFKGQISDQIRELERKGIGGSYISTSIKPMISYLKFHDVVVRLNINIKNENRNFNAEKEIVPDRDQIAKVLRIANLKERASISLMAFSGLRPEVLGNIDGTDGLIISDLPDINVSKGKVEFNTLPCRINVRPELSKIRQKYFTFVGEEGCRYLKEYLEFRISKGEDLRADSPLILPDPDMQRNERKNRFLMTTLLLRMIKKYIVKAGFEWRPYIFRVYFGTNLDMAESKGMISHSWRQFIMGHKGDIEETYTRREGLVEEGRDAYGKCLKFLQTEQKGISDEDKQSIEKSLTGTVLKKVFGFSDSEIEGMMELSDEELQRKIQEKIGNPQDKEKVRDKAHSDAREVGKRKNGSRQVMIPISYVDEYFSEGFEYVAAVNGDKAIMRLP